MSSPARPGLGELLAAASAAPTAAELAGEEAAVAAFRTRRPAPRRAFGVKTADTPSARHRSTPTRP